MMATWPTLQASIASLLVSISSQVALQSQVNTTICQTLFYLRLYSYVVAFKQMGRYWCTFSLRNF